MQFCVCWGQTNFLVHLFHSFTILSKWRHSGMNRKKFSWCKNLGILFPQRSVLGNWFPSMSRKKVECCLTEPSNVWVCKTRREGHFISTRALGLAWSEVLRLLIKRRCLRGKRFGQESVPGSGPIDLPTSLPLIIKAILHYGSQSQGQGAWLPCRWYKDKCPTHSSGWLLCLQVWFQVASILPSPHPSTSQLCQSWLDNGGQVTHEQPILGRQDIYGVAWDGKRS